MRRMFLTEFQKQGRVVLDWYSKDVKPALLADIVPDQEAAKHAAVFSADMINGFCKKGNLASPRVDAISRPVADLFTKLHKAGVEDFVLVQEWHDERAKEFEAFPEHGVAGTEEAEAIPELLELLFAHKFITFRKNSLTPAFSQRQIRIGEHRYAFWGEFEEYLREHDIHTAIVVGNCTDLCVRELAMYLKMWANENQKDMRVVIPINCVETFDLPQDIAKKIGAMPHPGDFYHCLALYEMARNSIDIVKKIV